MHWYLVHTKPRHEKCALENLQRQGYECYLPVLQHVVQSGEPARLSHEPLFPRYLFIRLDHGESAKSWSPIRSTRGVSRLVSFGAVPARVDDKLIEALKAQESRANVSDGRTAGPCYPRLADILNTANGERRAMALVEILATPPARGVQMFPIGKTG